MILHLFDVRYQCASALLVLSGRWWMLAYSCESGLSEVLLRETWTQCEGHLFASPEEA